MFHDIDWSGIAIGLKVPGIVYLGLDFEFLEELAVSMEEVEQAAHKTGHWKWANS